MAQFCPNCKNEVGPEDAFCGNCGQPLLVAAPKVPVAAVGGDAAVEMSATVSSGLEAISLEDAPTVVVGRNKPVALPPEPLEFNKPVAVASEPGLASPSVEPFVVPPVALPLEPPMFPLPPLELSVAPVELPVEPPVEGPIGFHALIPVQAQPTPERTAEPVYKPRPDPWLCQQCNTLNADADEYCNTCGAMRVAVLPPEPLPAQVSAKTSAVSSLPRDILELALAPHKEGDPRLGWRYTAGQATNEGVARYGSLNEDSLFRLELIRMFESKPEPLGLYIVADGMGGQDAGEVASRLTIGAVVGQVLTQIVVPWMAGQNLEKAQVEEALRQAVEEGHHSLRRYNQENNSESGTTLTAACLLDNYACFANVGDSRTYLFRHWKEKPAELIPAADENARSKSKTMKLNQRKTGKLSSNGNPLGAEHAADAVLPPPRFEIQRVTRDQSLVQNLVDDGKLTADEVYTDSRRNVVLNAIGAPEQNIPVDTYRRELEPGDRLLLCSDGMWEMARDPDIAERILNLDDPQVCADELVALALRNGGADNVSVIVVQVERI